MSETKLEGDDAITLAMFNAVEYRRRDPLSLESWKLESWDTERDDMHRALAWVREHLVAPAVAEARQSERESARVAVDRMRKERDELRAKVDEWNGKACSLQHELNRVNEDLASRDADIDRMSRTLKESHRLAVDYVGEIRELKEKVAALEAQVEAARRDAAVGELQQLHHAIVLEENGPCSVEGWKAACHFWARWVSDRTSAIERGRVQPQPAPIGWRCSHGKRLGDCDFTACLETARILRDGGK